MRFSGLPLSLLIPLAAPLLAAAQDQSSNSSSSSNSSTTYAQDCVSALQAAGFTQLADTLTKINQTEQGQALFTELSSGRNYTLFAPDDAAFQNVSSEVSGNSSLLAEYISYHFVNGDFTNTSYTNTSASGGGGGSTTSSTTTETSTQSSSESTSTETSTATETATTSAGSAAVIFERLFGRQDQSNSSTSDPQPFSGVYPNVTIGRTLLNASNLVNLEGNKSQVLVWTRSGEDGNVTIWNQAQNVTVTNGTRWNNLFINGITSVLVPPGNLTSALAALDANAATLLLNNTQLTPGGNSSSGGGSSSSSTMTESATSTETTTDTATETATSSAGLSARQDQGGNSTDGDNGSGDNNGGSGGGGAGGSNMNMTAIQVLQQAKGITVFVPSDSAFTSDVNQTLASIMGNASAQSNIISNHYINGTTLYSTEITNDTHVTTAAGEVMSFSTNDTGIFVTVGNNTAQVTRPDVLLDNGVAHVINGVLISQDQNPDAAASAYQSATSEAAMSTTETAPVGVGTGGSMSTSTESQSSMSSSESSSSASSSSESSSTQTSTSTETQTSTTSQTQSAFVIRGLSMKNGAVMSTSYGIVASTVTSVIAGVCLLVAV